VIHCDPGEQAGNYLIAVNFEPMSDTDRQLIAKHVMQVQLEAKRKHLAEE
jgi:c-di-GMP-binding flagellar brake protein YcgR